MATDNEPDNNAAGQGETLAPREPARTPPVVIALASVIGMQALALAIFTVAIILVALAGSSGIVGENLATVIVGEVVLYVIFVVALIAIFVGIRRRSHIARAPAIVAQLFGLVIAYTFTQGTGVPVRLAGVLVGISCIAGLYCAFNRATGAYFAGDPEPDRLS